MTAGGAAGSAGSAGSTGVERRIAELSRRLLRLRPEDATGGIVAGLRTAGEIAGADRVQFAVTGRSETDVPSYFQWCAEGVPPRPEPDWSDAVRSFRWSSEQLVRGDVLRISRVAELPPEAAAEREQFEADGIHAYLGIPVSDGEGHSAFLDFAWIQDDADWSDAAVERLRLLAEMLISAIKRMRIEVALRASEARFRNLVTHASDTLCELDATGRLLFASPNMKTLLGFTTEELRARHVVSLIHPDDRGAIAEQRIERREMGISTTRTYRMQHADGSWRWIEASARGFETAAGELRAAVVLRDATDTHQRRAELERQLQVEKGLTELARDFLDVGAAAAEVAIDHGLEMAAGLAGADRCFLVASVDEGEPLRFDWRTDVVKLPAFSIDWRMFGRGDWLLSRLFAGETVCAVRPSDLPDEARHLREIYTQVGVKSFLLLPIRRGNRLVGTLGLECHSEEHEWQDHELALFQLTAGMFLSLVRRKHAEDELRSSQVQLVQAQKMEAVGTLAGGIAHDFNNQLAVMLGNARHLLRVLGPSADSSVGESLVDLERAAEHCAQLTRSLLAFSRRGAVSPRSVELAEVVSNAGELLEPLMPRAIEFSVQIADDPGSVIADPTQLQQVLVNLAVNARDAMPSGGRLEIRAGRRALEASAARRLGLSASGDFAEVVVADQGVGMDAETRTRIFEPFFTTKDVGEGTGLGLATAYGIVQDCRGAITVDSVPGVGSTFRVYLPLADATHEPLDEGEARPAPAPSRGGVVLLAEDEGGVRRFVARLLRAAGHQVLEASDGVEALERLDGSGSAPDFLVTDLEMPRMGGVELAECVTERMGPVRVLFLSGYTPDRLLAQRPPVPGARFLQKPFTEQQVLDELARLRSDPLGEEAR